MSTTESVLTVKTQVDAPTRFNHGTIVLRVSDQGKETVHRLPMPANATSETRAGLQAVLEALQWGCKLHRKAMVVEVENEDIVRLIKREIPVTEHVTGPFLQIRALIHCFHYLRFDCPPGLAKAV